MNIADIDISNFKYVSTYADPNRLYYGSAACSFIASDVITWILHNRKIVPSCEPRYFSHVVDINTSDSYWVISIDMDLLDFDNFEIVAVCIHNDTRIHCKNDKWFDNIGNLKGKGAIKEAVAMHKAIECIIRELKYLYSNRSKTYCAVLAENYADDFEEQLSGHLEIEKEEEDGK